MSSKIGIQSQSGIIQDASKLLAKHPIAWMLLGNALSLDFAKRIRAESPDTLIPIRAQADNWSLDAGVVDFAERSMRVAEPFQRAGVCDFLLPPNEPVVQNDVNARRLNEQMVQCAEIYKAYGYKTLAYNFSAGNPDYPLWQYLADGIDAADGWLGLHEYGAPNLQRDAGNLSLRHRNVKPLLPAGTQSRLKIGIDECFIDLGIGRPPDGEPTSGGYRALRNPKDDDLWWIWNLTTQLDWWDAELAKDDYVIFTTGYGYAMQEPWVGLGFDVANVDTDRAYYINWQRAGKAVIPPNGGSVITPAETIATVPFLVKRAIQLDLGPSIYGEYDAQAANGDLYHAWIWQRGGVIVRDGDYGDLANAKLFNPQTGAPMSAPLPWPGGNPTPPAQTRIKTSDLPSEYGIVVESYAPKLGEMFFGLVGAGNFKSGPQVGTQTTMQAANQNGSLAVGFTLTHAYDAANQKSESFPSPSVGVILGPGSYYNAGQPPPDRFYVSKGASPAGTWPAPYPCDIVHAGMPNGQHFEATYTWQLMQG